jgi:hypothetical protein
MVWLISIAIPDVSLHWFGNRLKPGTIWHFDAFLSMTQAKSSSNQISLVPDIAIMNDRETEIVVQPGVLEAGAKGSHRYFENIAIQRLVIATMEHRSSLQFRISWLQ